MNPEADWAAFLGVFFLGLGLNLTPCVYPMLTVTVSLFSSRSDKNPRQAFVPALAYVLGIAGTNTILGTMAAMTGELFGALLQHPAVLITIAAFLAYLGASLFGHFTFQLPAWVTKRVSGSRRISWSGFFLSGMLVGVFAAPCMGPPLLAVLAWVATQGRLDLAISVFFVLSLGLGAPYLILGTFSGLLVRLPKSGGWLVWFERLFGVMLFGLAGFYFSLAVLPLFVKWVFPAALAGGGLYLGFGRHGVAYSGRFNFFRKIAGIFALMLAIWVPLSQPRVSVFWEDFSQERFQQSLAAGKPVVLDFFADWCIPCHELEQLTYSDPAVIQALQPFDRYKVDLTGETSPEVSGLLQTYGVEGVPTVVFLDSQGREIPELRVAGFVRPREFLERVAQYPLSDSVPKADEAA